jgi:dTDP-4-dehydrorhamnose reductase
MLGHKLCQVLSDRHEVWATTTDAGVDLLAVTTLPASRVISGFDALAWPALTAILNRIKPDAVINAVGIVKQSDLMSNSELAIAVNATLPQHLDGEAIRRGFRFIHLSTDCVFSGDKGRYKESDLPDAVDLYGRSKLLGETELSGALVLRTSMIGRELRHSRGLLEWLLLHEPGPVPGYTNAYFSGLPTVVLSRAIERILEDDSKIIGCYHVASDRISKFELLTQITKAVNGPWQIVTEPSLNVDRSLDGGRFSAETGIRFAEWPMLIAEMIADSAFSFETEGQK